MENNLITQDVAIDYQQGTLKLNNAEELKSAINAVAKRYDHLVVTEDTVKSDKQTRRELSKLSRNIDRKRIDGKKAYSEPINKFDAEMKAIKEPLDKVIGDIKAKTDYFDKQAKDNKQQQIQDFIDELCTNKGISSDNIQIDSRWLNKTTSKKQWQEAATKVFEFEAMKQHQIQSDVQTIQAFAQNMGVQPDSYIYQIKHGAGVNEVIQNINLDIEKQKSRQEAKKASTKEVGDKRVDTTTGEVEDILTYQMTVKGDKQSLTQLKQFMRSNGIEVLKANLMGGND